MMVLLRLLLKLHSTFIFPGLNVVFRKLASQSKPSMEILVDDNAVKIRASALVFQQCDMCRLGRASAASF